MGMCSRQSGMCTWALYSSEVKTLTSLGRGHWWPHKTRCNHSNRAYCQRKSLRMHVGFMALEENFKSISRKVRIIETPMYCEKESGGHSVKKGCSGHVGNVGEGKAEVLCSALGPALPSQEAVFTSQSQKHLRQYYPSQKK